MKHTKQELIQWQNLPLNIKILMTKERIRNWINEYGEDGVYAAPFAAAEDLLSANSCSSTTTSVV